MQQLSVDHAIVGIAGRDSVEQMQAFVDRHELEDVVHVADTTGELWARFGVFGQPSWAFVDGETGRMSVRFGALGRQGVLDAFQAGGF